MMSARLFASVRGVRGNASAKLENSRQAIGRIRARCAGGS